MRPRGVRRSGSAATHPRRAVFSLKLIGADELEAVLKKLPYKIGKQARKAGMAKAASRMRTRIRRHAWRGRSGNLVRSINVDKGRSRAWVGLTTRFYYEVLDLQSKRGPPLRPWFEAAVEKHAPEVAELLIKCTMQVIGEIAGREYAKSLMVRG